MMGSGRGVAMGVSALVTSPTVWVGNGALIAWMIRLLVCTIQVRGRAGGATSTKDASLVFWRWTYAGMEAAFWIGVALHGMERYMAVLHVHSRGRGKCALFDTSHLLNTRRHKSADCNVVNPRQASSGNYIPFVGARQRCHGNRAWTSLDFTKQHKRRELRLMTPTERNRHWASRQCCSSWGHSGPC